ncbi:MAG TPA: hypothetical protein VK906_06490 [Egicoccus sp.]|nr:hypothetical protein [Egicoccus sp.]HSK22803.1 hypothetical protein [Egicoccus sp.]
MRTPRIVPLLVLLALSGACSGVQERVDEVRGTAQELTDRARFCLSVTRAATALEEGNVETAAEAAQEAAAQAPEELRGDARTLADAAEAVRGGDRGALDDPAVVAAADRLREEARAICDPTG